MERAESSSNLGARSTAPRTVAAVLTHRRPRMASQSVRYLLDHEGLEAEDIVVVINGEGGLDDPDLARSVTMHHLDENLGPAGGMRAALELATEDGNVGWVYLCEDDIGASRVPAPRLVGLRSLADEHERRTGARVGAVVAYSRTLDRRTGISRPHVPGPTDAGLVPTDVAGWGASLVSRKVVDAGILPDASFFFGYEDFDFWLSMQRAGFELLLDVACARTLGLSVHPSGREQTLGDQRTIDDTEPWRRYYEARNFVHLRRRHGHAGWTAAHLAKSLRRASMGNSAHRSAIASGLYDGLRGRTGLDPRHQRHPDAGEKPEHELSRGVD